MITGIQVNYELENSNVHLPDEGNVKHGNTHTVSLTCPHCGRDGSFAPIPSVSDATFRKTVISSNSEGKNVGRTHAEMSVGVRSCPNPECRGVVAVLYSRVGNESIRLRWIAPPEVIGFNAHNIPEKIIASMKEAIGSNSVGAFRASALMVRRSLELLCEEKGAKGKDLKERISKLAGHVVISPTLLKAANHLRILGNSAAHVEAKEYDDIDKEHSELAIELAKEILKAVYQHDDLIARLARLQK